MALPTLLPASNSSKSILPETGSHGNVHRLLPYKIYSDNASALYSGNFISGAVDQVAYTYKKLGGDVLDIELSDGNIYAAYEEAVLEYSYLINVHQASNALPSFLGHNTGTFDHKGELTSGPVSASLKYPKFDYGFARNVGEAVGAEVGLADAVEYSASFDVTVGQQDYDLQKIITESGRTAASGSVTITNIANLTNDGTHSLSFAATDGSTITATITAATTTTHTNSPTFAIGADEEATAENLKTCLDANSRLTATRSGAVVTIKQVGKGYAGNGAITLTDPNASGMSKTDFANGGNKSPFSTSDLDGRRIIIKNVFYKTPSAMWRFYGYYGGLNVVGNMHNYGQFSDDSTFQLVPTWQNKSQALAFEDAIYTRMSHWSYELINNKIRLFPIPYSGGPEKMWVRYSLPASPTIDQTNGRSKIDGVNNMNTLPFSNLPYDTINSIGKQWIRRFALALAKEMLGLVRSKFASLPIPGESVTLNGSELVSQGKEEQNSLREELKTTLSEMTYVKMAEQESAMMDNAENVLKRIPDLVYVG